MWGLLRSTITERKLSVTAKKGALIALIGLFCPLFWTALFMGASKKELIFHGTHSAIIFLTGLVLMVAGMVKDRQKEKKQRTGTLK
jgi:ABC-type arginine transport system permease subunit